MSEQQPLNIYQRINNVRDAVKYLQKDAKVEGYKAISHDAVTSACREHLTAQGVIIVPNQTSSDVVQVGQTSKGTAIIRYSGWYTVQFVNMDDPTQAVSVTVEAHANDHGDKAPGKALSYAVKSAMLKLFTIETGENEESRIEIAEGLKPITEEQAQELDNLITEVNADKSRFLQHMKVTKLSDIRQQAFPDAKAALEKKRGNK